MPSNYHMFRLFFHVFYQINNITILNVNLKIYNRKKTNLILFVLINHSLLFFILYYVILVNHIINVIDVLFHFLRFIHFRYFIIMLNQKVIFHYHIIYLFYTTLNDFPIVIFYKTSYAFFYYYYKYNYQNT